MHAEMFFDIRHQIPEAFTRLIAGAQVMHIATSALDRAGAGTISRQQEQGVLLIGPRGHDLRLGALKHPGIADLGQRMEIEGIYEHHGLVYFQLLAGTPDTG